MGLERPPSRHAPPLAAAAFAADEQQLVAAILRKDRKAAAEFVSRYADPVYGYVRHRLAPRADLVEDVVQDVFLAALDSLASFRGDSLLRSWLLGIARHKVEGYYREQLRTFEPLGDNEDTEPTADDPLIDEVIDRDRIEARIHGILQQLPESYSLVLLWRYWEGRSAREMASATGKTEKAVERLLARARTRFRELWEQT
jgi:RNA polymerase sigma-70 factor (ECF subfamily)